MPHPARHRARAKPAKPRTRRVPKTRAQILAALTPKPTPAPAPSQPAPTERAHTIGLLDILLGLVRLCAAKAHAAFQAAGSAAFAGRRDPNLPMARILRAATRILMLIARLEEPTPLPTPTPLQAKTPAPLQPPRAPVPITPRLRHRSEQSLARQDIQRLLRTRTLPEIIAIICRDLGIPPDPATWPRPHPQAAPTPTPPRTPRRPAPTVAPLTSSQTRVAAPRPHARPSAGAPQSC